MIGLNYVGVSLLGLGGLFSLWTLRAFVRRRALLRDPVKVEGVVIRVRHEMSSSDEAGSSYPGRFHATVRFKTEEGNSIERELPPTRDSTECRMGAVIPLVYQRGCPRNVVYADMRWADLVSSAIGTLIILGFGALLYFCVEATPAKPPASAQVNPGP
jgi:hypothetical protein